MYQWDSYPVQGFDKSPKTMLCQAAHTCLDLIRECPMRSTVNSLVDTIAPCEQRLHFCCVSCHVKSSLCRQPFKSVQKFGQINLTNGFFPVFIWFRGLLESCVADQSCRNFFIPTKLAPVDDRPWRFNFACESRDKFCACMIENWTIVGAGYFSHAPSHSENVASARRVTLLSLTLTWDEKWICRNLLLAIMSLIYKYWGVNLLQTW